MKITMPITKKRIETHFHYAWWIYALVLVIGIFGWNLMHTVTRYQSPPELKVELYFGGYQLDDGTGAEALMEKAHQEALPDMEEVTYRLIMMDDMYGDMQLTTWAFAGEGRQRHHDEPATLRGQRCPESGWHRPDGLHCHRAGKRRGVAGGRAHDRHSRSGSLRPVRR